MGARPAQTTNQIGSRQDVSPLIAPTHLQSAVESIEENQVVVSLQQRISKFRERDSFLRFQAPADRLFAEQTIHSEVLADIAQKFHHRDWAQPIVVVDNKGRIFLRVEIQEVTQLLFNSDQIFFDLGQR